jgi:hypothetical protein
LRIGLFNDNHTLLLYQSGFYGLLLCSFQGALVLGLTAHTLNSVHHITLLCQKGIAEVGRPLNIICQTIGNVRKSSERLNACIPTLFPDAIGKCLVLEGFVFA